MKVSRAKKLYRCWQFRRSALQSAVINISYGLISASVAELTGGFLWTDDGAWINKKFRVNLLNFINGISNQNLRTTLDARIGQLGVWTES